MLAGKQITGVIYLCFVYFSLQQTQQRPDLARLMQLHASGAAAAAPAGLPPGLLPGPPGAPGPAGLPTALLAGKTGNSGSQPDTSDFTDFFPGIPSSLAGPHPAFASLLAQQKPNPAEPAPLPAPPGAARPSKDEELKKAISEINGSKLYLFICIAFCFN